MSDTNSPVNVSDDDGIWLPWSGILISVTTTGVFLSANHWLRTSGATQPATTRGNGSLSWRWRNVLLSLIHSLISGLWSIFCALTLKSLMPGMMKMESRSAYFLASFSHGYFMYDLAEMVTHMAEKGGMELVVHHVFVMACLLVSVLHRQYLGFACMALAVEVSNVFLHARSLMKMAGLEHSRLFSVHRYLNLVFFVIFRLLVMLFLVYCMYEYQSVVPYGVFCMGMAGGAVVLVMSGLLLYRLIRSDFRPCVQTHASKAKDEDDSTVTSLAAQEKTGSRDAGGGDRMSAGSSDGDPIRTLQSMPSSAIYSLAANEGTGKEKIS